MLSIGKKLNWPFLKSIVIAAASWLICTFTLFDLPAYPEVYGLPSADKILPVSADTSNPILKGIKIDPANPFRIEFIIDQKNATLLDRDEAHRLVSYFFAALTVPEADLWVNLSPYESERIIPGALGITDMGKDMLGQDYILKQLVSSLTYPESASGKKYWETVYKQVYLLAGKTDIAVNTFNKVWIVPAHALIHENGNVAILVSSRLKALTEEDYTALAKNRADTKQVNAKDISRVAAQALKETLLSQIEWDINHGEHFSRLRQLYSSFVLAAWFKHKMQDTIFQYYIDHNKVKGIDLSDKSAKEKIYNLYTSAFNKGVYSYVKREFDQNSRKIMRRQYFSGGIAISADAAIRQPVPLPVVGRDCQRIERPATLVVDVTKADSRSPFEITEQEVRSRDIASLMGMIDRIFPVSDPANSEINAIIKGLLQAQLAKVDNISVLVPDADHLFRALENIKSFYTKNDILRGKMMAAFGKGDNDKTLKVLTVAILLSKIGFGHPEIDPTQRKTLENNRRFAAELLEPVKKKLGDALGLTPEQTDSFITAIRYQGSYGVSSADYSNPLTTLLTLASELDITRDRLQGWQTHKPLLRVLLRVASNPEVVALYTEMTQLNLTLQAAQGEEAVAAALRKKNEYGRALDKRLSEIFTHEALANREKIISELIESGQRPESAAYIFEKFKTTLASCSSESYLWYISSYGLKSIEIKGNTLTFLYDIDEFTGLGAAAKLTAVRNFHVERIRRIIDQINNVNGTNFEIITEGRRQDPRLFEHISVSAKAETHSHLQMAADFDADIWDQLITGAAPAPDADIHTALMKSQQLLENLRQKYYTDRGVTPPGVGVDLIGMFNSANQSIAELFQFVQDYGSFIGPNLPARKDDVAEAARRLINMATTSSLSSPEAGRKLSTLSANERETIRIKIANYYRIKYAMRDLYNFVEGGLEDFVPHFMATAKLLKQLNGNGAAAQKKSLRNAMRQYQQDGVKYAGLRFNISQSDDPEQSYNETRAEVLNVIAAYNEYCAEQRALGNADKIPELKLVLSITKFPHNGTDPAASRAHKEGSVRTFVRILDELERPDSPYRGMVAGIDAAGREEGNPPELFFAAYKILDDFLENKRPDLKGKIGKTFHVGESIRDVSAESGLRFVFEALYMSRLGDKGIDLHQPILKRLGHAIMLGIDYNRLIGTTRTESIAERIQQIEFDLKLLELGIPLIGLDEVKLNAELRELKQKSPNDSIRHTYTMDDAINLETRSGFILDLIIQNGTVIETNPTSNVGVSEFITGYANHTLKRFLDYRYGDWIKTLRMSLGANSKYSDQLNACERRLSQSFKGQRPKVSISTDDAVLFGTTLTEEIYRIAIALDLSREEVDSLIAEGFESRFGRDPPQLSPPQTDDKLGGIALKSSLLEMETTGSFAKIKLPEEVVNNFKNAEGVSFNIVSFKPGVDTDNFLGLNTTTAK